MSTTICTLGTLLLVAFPLSDLSPGEHPPVARRLALAGAPTGAVGTTISSPGAVPAVHSAASSASVARTAAPVASTARTAVSAVSAARAAVSPAGQPQPRLRLEEALARARDNHPGVLAALLAATAQGHRADQAGRWDNPRISVYQESFPDALPDTDQTVVSLSQRLRIGGQRALQVREARTLERALEADARGVRRRVVHEVQRVYVRALGAQRRLAVVREARALVEELVAALRARHREGDVSRYDVLRMETELERLAATERRAEAARAAGLHLLGRWTASEVPEGGWHLVDPATDDDAPPPASSERARRQLEGGPPPRAELRPEVEAARMRHAAAETRRTRVGRQRTPDLTVSVGYTRLDPALDGFTWNVTAQLPLFDRRRAAEAAAEVEARRLERRVDELRQAGVAESRAAWSEYVELTRSLRERPAGAEPGNLVTMARVAYQEGEMSVTELADASRTALETGLRRISLEEDRILAWYRWQHAGGVDAPDTGGDR